MTNPELQLQLVLLLEAEPTRSLDVAQLHREVRERLGPRSPSLGELYRELRADRSFLLLERESGLGADVEAAYGPALDAAGLRPPPRVVLAADAAAESDHPLSLAGLTLRTLLERNPAAAAEVADAFAQIERVTPHVRAALEGDAAAPSTTPPPGPPAPARTRRRWRSPPSRPTPPAGSRSG